MNLTLTPPVTPRSESLAFLSLSANDLDCLDRSLETSKPTHSAEPCVVSKIQARTQDEQAQTALCELIKTLAASNSADEFTARRDRLFPQYVDLMLGLGRILHALTDRVELNRRVKAQLEAAEKFFSGASEQFCPMYLKDQALFSLWELGKVVDLADFIQSRPPLREAEREEDMRLASNCTIALLFGRLHLDCLGYAISTKRVFSEDLQYLLGEGMRHFVNGHVAIRLAARLRQKAEDADTAELLSLDEEDREHLACSMAGQDDEEY